MEGHSAIKMPSSSLDMETRNFIVLLYGRAERLVVMSKAKARLGDELAAGVVSPLQRRILERDANGPKDRLVTLLYLKAVRFDLSEPELGLR